MNPISLLQRSITSYEADASHYRERAPVFDLKQCEKPLKVAESLSWRP
jgi:hypothetical protein